MKSDININLVKLVPCIQNLVFQVRPTNTLTITIGVALSPIYK